MGQKSSGVDRTNTIGAFDVNVDESCIALSTNLGGRFNLWGLAPPNTFPYPLTYHDQYPNSVSFDPQGRYILVTFDRDGDENSQIYAISPTGGGLVSVRLSPGHRHVVGGTSADGNRIYYISDKDNDRFMNVYRYDIESEREETIFEGYGGPVERVSVAPDESSFAYVRELSNTHYLAHVVTNGEHVCLTPDAGRMQVSTRPCYVDENTIVFITNYDSPFTYLAKYDLTSRSFSVLFQPEKQDVSALTVNEQGRVFCLTECGVQDHMYEGDLAEQSFRQIEFPGTVGFDIKLHRSGRLYGLFTKDNVPRNLYRRELDGSWTKLTNIGVIGAAEGTLGQAQTVHFPSFDGLMMEGLLWRAPLEVRNGHTIVHPHGGPQESDRKWFWAMNQYLLLEGYDVFSVNFRGSTGYGTEFTKMIERDFGGAPRKDILAGIEYLIANDLAERKKLFVMGSSYGGYMALLLHGQHADYFRAVVDMFGPSNLFTLLESVPESWKPTMEQLVGNPEHDREKLIEDSPMTYIDAMSKPMLIIQGANDPRVVQAESDQIVNKLRESGREVEYMVFKDEGHGFSKKENELKVYQTIAEFLRRHQVRQQ